MNHEEIRAKFEEAYRIDADPKGANPSLFEQDCGLYCDGYVNFAYQWWKRAALLEREEQKPHLRSITNAVGLSAEFDTPEFAAVAITSQLSRMTGAVMMLTSAAEAIRSLAPKDTAIEQNADCDLLEALDAVNTLFGLKIPLSSDPTEGQE